MVQISEYTHRETISTDGRSKLSLNMPEAISRASGQGPLSNDTINNLRTIAKGGKEIANAMVEMKDNFDKAKVNEYINSYMADTSKTILGYEQNRKGRNAYGLVQDFEKYSQEHFSKAMGTSGDGSEKPLLENRDQIRMAQAQMDKLNLNYMNQISSYQAKEIQNYQDNQASALITNLGNQLVAESDPVSIANSIQMMRESIRGMNQYKGQSNEYINSKINPLISKSLSQNVLSVAMNNPDLAIAKMQDGLFKNNMDNGDYIQTKVDVIKAFKETYSTTIAEDSAYQRPQRVSLPDTLNNEFFKDVNINRLMTEIMDEAGKKEKTILETNRENSNRLQNDIILSSGVVDADGNIDINSFTNNDFLNIGSTEGGNDTLQTIKSVQQNLQNEKFNLTYNGAGSVEITDDQVQAYNTVSKNIRSGYYDTLGQMKNDIDGLPATAQAELVGNFVGRLQQQKNIDLLKKKGIDIEKDIKYQFSERIGLNPDKNAASFNAFRDAIINKVSSASSIGEKITPDKIMEITDNVVDDIFNDKSDLSIVRKMVIDLDTQRVSSYSKGNITTQTDLEEWATQIANEQDMDDLFDKATMKRFANRIINGDVEGAVFMMNTSRKNTAIAATKKAKDIEERKATIDKRMAEYYSDPMFMYNPYGY